MQPPDQITPATLADYLEVLTKAVFESGMNWKVIENKWPGFQAAFHGFDPDRIAGMTPDEVDALTGDTRIIRNRRKIDATIFNARAILQLEHDHGSFKDYLQSQGDFWSTSKALKKQFKHIGDFGTYYFLYVIGEPVPEHDEFRAKLLEGTPK